MGVKRVTIKMELDFKTSTVKYVTKNNLIKVGDKITCSIQMPLTSSTFQVNGVEIPFDDLRADIHIWSRYPGGAGNYTVTIDTWDGQIVSKYNQDNIRVNQFEKISNPNTGKGEIVDTSVSEFYKRREEQEKKEVLVYLPFDKVPHVQRLEE